MHFFGLIVVAMAASTVASAPITLVEDLVVEHTHRAPSTISDAAELHLVVRSEHDNVSELHKRVGEIHGVRLFNKYFVPGKVIETASQSAEPGVAQLSDDIKLKASKGLFDNAEESLQHAVFKSPETQKGKAPMMELQETSAPPGSKTTRLSGVPTTLDISSMPTSTTRTTSHGTAVNQLSISRGRKRKERAQPAQQNTPKVDPTYLDFVKAVRLSLEQQQPTQPQQAPSGLSKEIVQVPVRQPEEAVIASDQRNTIPLRLEQSQMYRQRLMRPEHEDKRDFMTGYRDPRSREMTWKEWKQLSQPSTSTSPRPSPSDDVLPFQRTPLTLEQSRQYRKFLPTASKQSSDVFIGYGPPMHMLSLDRESIRRALVAGQKRKASQ